MLVKIIRALVAVLMVISPALPQKLSLPAIYHDFKKSVDRDDTTGATTLTSGMFQPHEIRNLAIGVFVIAAVGGVALVLLTGLPLLWIGLAGAALTLLYPMLKYNALGDVDILLTFAFLPTIGTAFVTTGAIDWSVLLIALPVGLITDGILHCNNTRDMVPDKRAEIKTLAMGLGAKASAVMYSILISGSSAFSKTSLNIRKFAVHVLLKPGLENFEHYFTSM